jgi:hypothetical protein
VEIFDGAPECPKAGDDGRKTHRNPSCYLALVKLLHCTFPVSKRVAYQPQSTQMIEINGIPRE